MSRYTHRLDCYPVCYLKLPKLQPSLVCMIRLARDFLRIEMYPLLVYGHIWVHWEYGNLAEVHKCLRVDKCRWLSTCGACYYTLIRRCGLNIHGDVVIYTCQLG